MGIAIPSLAFPLTELAKLRNVEADKYLKILGCHYMALCNQDENVVSLATQAARRALNNWQGDLKQIGLVIVATETSVDMSRPLSSWVMEALELQGQIRSYEVKHACYGGTAAIRQAMEWKLSGNSKGKAALVIAADVALYAPEHSGEPTQGAGAVALIIDKPTIAKLDLASYYWSEPRFDFWRPIANKYPEVNGRLSLSCYINAAMQCFTQVTSKEELPAWLEMHKYICFHVPFPKMVFSAVKRIGEYCSFTNEQLNSFYEKKIFSTMVWNQQVGNSYTASLWFAVSHALTKSQSGDKIAAFSYGSGCGAELLTMQCLQNQAESTWLRDLNQDLAQRNIIDAQAYQLLREKL